MNRNHYAQYKENQLLMASPAQLLLATYDGAIRFCKIAGEKMLENKYEEQNTNIKKAVAIVCELMNTLKDDVSPDLVHNLRSLYSYVLDRLTRANLYQDIDALNEVIKILTQLRQTWAEAEKIIKEQNLEAAA